MPLDLGGGRAPMGSGCVWVSQGLPGEAGLVHRTRWGVSLLENDDGGCGQAWGGGGGGGGGRGGWPSKVTLARWQLAARRGKLWRRRPAEASLWNGEKDIPT